MHDISPDHREVEWQFDALDVRPVERWLEDRSGSDAPAISAKETREITDTYFDTGDWRLYRAGYALRIRVRAEGKESTFEATMKSLDPESYSTGAEGLRSRREISEPIENMEPDALRQAPGLLGHYLRSLDGSLSLRPLFDVRTRRSAYALDFDGESAGEVVLDETEIPLQNVGEPVQLRRVEVEQDGRSDLLAFVEELREGCKLTPARASKYEAALFASGLTPPEPPELGPANVDESLTAGELAFAVMREQFGEFLAHEPGTRIGEDPEELHDMRVASRRLRVAMRVFSEALPVRMRRMRRELKRVADALGEVRDVDVQLEQLEDWVSGVGQEDREALGDLRGALRERREKARRAMIRTLDSRRYVRFVETFTGYLVRGPSRRSRIACRPVLAVGPDLIRHRYRRVRKLGDRLGEESSGEEYHKLRKRGRRLRYTLEFLSEIYGKPASSLVSALKTLQDVLGEHQDAEVAIEHLRRMSLAPRRGRKLPPHAVFVMGGIAQRYAAQARQCRRQYPDAYGGITGKPWKDLKKTMDKRRPAAEAS